MVNKIELQKKNLCTTTILVQASFANKFGSVYVTNSSHDLKYI